MTQHKRQGLIFDGDDTLWDSQIFYEEVKLRFYEILQRQGGLAEYFQSAQITYEDTARLIDEIDMRGVDREGVSSKLFSKSLIEAYGTLSTEAGVLPDPRVSQRLWRLGRIPARRRRSPLPGARETLQALSAHHSYILVLYSTGTERTQMRKLRQVGLEEFFDARVHIVPRKDDDTLRAVIRAENLDIPSSWMIGNSLRSEINPGLRLGLNCIWLHHGGWAYDQAGEIESGRLFEIHALPEIVDILAQAEMRTGSGDVRKLVKE